MRKLYSGSLFFFLLWANTLSAQVPISNFLQGTWKTDGRDSYEYWSKLSETSFKGFSYQQRNGDMRVSEYLEITVFDSTVVYTASVINQNKGKGVQFTLSPSDSAFVFENPEHDFPKMIIYRPLNENKIKVTVSDGGSRGFSYILNKVIPIAVENPNSPSKEHDESKIEQNSLHNYLNTITEVNSFSGSVLIARKGKVILNKGYGFADYENNVPNTNATLHRIGSLTKPFTAMATLKLISTNNGMSIMDPIGNYIPNLPRSWREVKIFHLLTHTSGIPDHFGDMDAVPVAETFKEIQKVLISEADKPLENIPGQTYTYNNFGYVLLGYLIELVSGEKYTEFLSQSVFIPLQMEKSTYDNPRQIIKGRSEGYRMSDSLRVNDKLTDPAAYSAGGLLSSTNDLFVWSQALNSNVILSQDQLKIMFTPYKSDYGLGWQIVYKHGRKMYNHNGGIHGFNSRLVYYPDEDIFIAVLGNNEDVRAASITCDLETLLFKETNRALSTSTEINTEELKRFVGQYQSESGDERTIEWENNSLLYRSGESQFELKALSGKTLGYSKYEDIRLDFIDPNTFVISSCGVNPKTFKRKM